MVAGIVLLIGACTGVDPSDATDAAGSPGLLLGGRIATTHLPLNPVRVGDSFDEVCAPSVQRPAARLDLCDEARGVERNDAAGTDRYFLRVYGSFIGDCTSWSTLHGGSCRSGRSGLTPCLDGHPSPRDGANHHHDPTVTPLPAARHLPRLASCGSPSSPASRNRHELIHPSVPGVRIHGRTIEGLVATPHRSTPTG